LPGLLKNHCYIYKDKISLPSKLFSVICLELMNS
jgi:hypothetical protein